jgi:hypothetical protein
MDSSTYINQQYGIYVGLFLFVFGMIGNIMNIFLLLVQRSYQTIPSTFFFLIICIHDTMTLNIGLLFRILITGFNINIDGNSIIFCKLRLYFLNSLAAIPTTCVALVTINQFLITSRIVRFRQLSTIKNAHRAAMCAIMFWIITCISYIIFVNISSITNVCSITSFDFGSYAILYSVIVRYSIPISIMIIFGFLAYRNMKQTVLLVQQGADRQWMGMILMLIILIIVGAVPYVVYSIYLQVTIAVPQDPVQLANESFVKTIINLNTYIQHAVSVKNEKPICSF